MSDVCVSKPCINMDKNKESFWHVTLKGKTTEVSVGKKGENPKHYPKTNHASHDAAVQYVKKLIEENLAAGYTLRKNRSVAMRHWVFSDEVKRCGQGEKLGKVKGHGPGGKACC